MFRKFLSVLLSVSLMLSMTVVFSHVSVSAVEDKPSNAEENIVIDDNITTEPDIIYPLTVNNLTTYYDSDDNVVEIPAGNLSSTADEESLPSTYDLRDEGRVTPVRDQGSEGFCWNFATTSSMESSILSNPKLKAALGENPIETLDFSEAGNAWFIHTNTENEDSYLYGDYLMDINKGSEGGNEDIIVQGLSSGFGTYPEELMTYDSWGKSYSEALRFYSDYRFDEYIVFDYDISLIKERVIDYGAMYLSFLNFYSNYYMSDNGVEVYYTNGNPLNGYEENLYHAVVIVGWDDNFSREHFPEEMRPENNGAWLIKNSWGTDSGSTAQGYEGYFWMSYESVMNRVAQITVQSAEEFDNIYQHQYTHEQSIGVESAANVFTAENDEILEQIYISNFYPVNLTVEVYKLSENYSSPEDGELLISFTDNVEFSGAHTIDVPETVELESGDTFSIVISSEERFYLGQRMDVNSVQLENVSFYMNDGQWQDVVSDYTDSSYLAIKAYTSNKDGAVYKDELSSLISEVENLEFKADTPQEFKDNISIELENAKNVLIDNNATQNTVDNTYCLLGMALDDYNKLYFDINSMDDFIYLYNASFDQKFADSVIYLNTDLDFSNTDIHKPLYNNSCFEGVFHGNGHTISNLKVSTKEGPCGLFAELKGATVNNLKFDNCTFNAERRAGAIAGKIAGSTITDCTVTNSEILTDARSSGGIVGMAEESFVSGCDISGASIISKHESAGGVLGSSFGTIIEDCSVSDTSIVAYYCATVYGDDYYNDCTSEDVSLKSLGIIMLEDNVTVGKISDNYDCYSMFVYEDGKLTLHPYLGTIVDATSDEAVVTKSGDIYEIELNDAESADIYITYESVDTGYFSYDFDFVTNEAELTYYFNYEDETATEIVFPSYIGNLKVTSLSNEFAVETVATVKSVVWSENIDRIPGFIFLNHAGIETVTIPANVTLVGYAAFAGCQNISDVYFGGTEEQWNQIIFSQSNEYLTKAEIHFAQEETTTAATEPSESTTVTESSSAVTEPTESTTVTEPSTVVTEPTESTTVTEPSTVVTEPTESTPIAESSTVVTEPSESTPVAEPSTVVTEPAESTTVTEPSTVVTEPSESTTVTEPSTVVTETSESTPVAESSSAVTETSESTTVTETTEPAQETTTTPQPEFEEGDVNRDGKLNIKDATAIQKYLAKMIDFDDTQISLADYNKDNKVNIKDVTHIQKKLARLI